MSSTSHLKVASSLPSYGFCVCQPMAVEFTLDFSRVPTAATASASSSPGLDCNLPTNFVTGEDTGIAELTCDSSTDTTGSSSSWTNWQVVDFVQITEYDDERLNRGTNPETSKTKTSTTQEEQDAFATLQLDGPFYNGHSFSYTTWMWRNALEQVEQGLAVASASDATSQSELPTPESILQDCRPRTCWMPSRLQIQLFGKSLLQEDELEQESQLLMDWDVTWRFTNDCNVFPVLVAGHYIGPLTLVRSTVCVPVPVCAFLGEPLSVCA